MPTDPANVQAANGATNGTLDPATVMGAAAAASSPAEAAGNAQATAQYGNVTTMANALNGYDVAQQRTFWHAQTPAIQAQLKAVGYQPPADPKEMGKPGRGLLGSVGHLFGMALTPVGHALQAYGHSVVHTLGDIVNAAGSPIRFTQHLARTAEYENQQQVMSGAGDWGNPFGPHGLFSPHAWTEGWNATTNGATSFAPQVLRDLSEHYDPHTLSLGKQVAAGIPEDQIVKGVPPAQQTALVQKLQQPEFKSLVSQLQNAHMTVGQWAVGEKFLNDHPGLGHALSGGIDAAYDWYADPINRPLRMAAVARKTYYAVDSQRAAEFMVRDGAEAEAANVQQGWSDYMAGKLQTPGINRAIQVAGDMLAKGQGTAFRSQFSRSIGPAYDQLVREGVDSPEKLHDWLQSQAGMNAVMSGRAARASAGMQVLPHLSPVGYAVAPVRAALRTSLDTLIDNPHPLQGVKVTKDMLLGAQGPLDQTPENLDQLSATDAYHGAIATAVRGGVSKVARLGRRLGTLTPSSPIDLTDPNGFEPLRRALLYSLPAKTVDDIGQFYGLASPSERRQIVVAAKAQMLHYAGAFAGDDSSSRIVEMMQNGWKQEAYAGGQTDAMANGERHGLLENQMAERQSLPNLHEVQRASRAENFLQRMGVPEWVPGTLKASKTWRAITDAGYGFMGLWRPAVLAREGFPLRIAIDENGNYMLRNGAMEAIKARVALHGYKGDINELAAARDAAERADRGLSPEVSNWARSVALFAHAVPAPILEKARSMKDIGTAVIGENAWRVLGHLGQGLSREDYYRAADALTDRWDVAGPSVLAIHHAGGGYDESEHIINWITAGQHAVPVRWREGAAWSSKQRDDPLFLLSWAKALDTYGSSKLARAALETIGNHPDTQMRHVLSVLESDDPAMERLRQLSPREHTTPDGKVIGIDKGIDTTTTHRAWARKIVKATNDLVTGAGGTVHHDLVAQMLDRHGAPDMDLLKEVDDLPKGVFGPDYVPVGRVQAGLSKAMNFFARQMDWLARQPNMLHATATNMRDVEPLVRSIQGDGPHAEQLLGDLAVQRAIGQIKPFIHNPELKTQFEVLHRTAAPFLFAQHQFLQRWGRTFLENPAAIREAQLLQNGLQNAGFFHKDAQGNWYFQYPLTGAAAGVVNHVLTHFGWKSSIGTSVPFTAEEKYLAPGLSNPLTPSAGPFMALPLKALAQLDPAFNGVEQALLQQGASQTYWEQVLPSSVSRVINGMIGDQTPGTVFASSMTNAITQAEALGYSPWDLARENGHVVNGVPVPTQQDDQEYLDRIRNWARSNMYLTALFGFVFPASPSTSRDTSGLDERLRQLLKELPYNDAVTEYLREHPNASPWTVSRSQGDSPGALPASQAAGQFIDANQQFMRDHPSAGGWFVPRTTGNQPFDPAVYREQIAYGLRNEKTPKQFLDDTIIAPAAKTYYAVYDAKQAAINADPNNTGLKQALNARFDQWRGQFLSLNPVFADALNGSQSGARRQQTISDINAALESPNVPQSPQATHIANVASVYNAWEQEYQSLAGNNSTVSYDRRKSLETSVITWGAQYAKDHADVSDLWTSVYLPQIRSITANIDYAVNPISMAQAG